jgi:hypothetical protein
MAPITTTFRRYGMDQQMRTAKQLMDLQRTSFDGMINNMIIYWDQTGRMLGAFLDQAPLMPDEGRKAFREWIDGNKKGCETFQTAVNDGFKRLESCFAGKPQDSEQ